MPLLIILINNVIYQTVPIPAFASGPREVQHCEESVETIAIKNLESRTPSLVVWAGSDGGNPLLESEGERVGAVEERLHPGPPGGHLEPRATQKTVRVAARTVRLEQELLRRGNQPSDSGSLQACENLGGVKPWQKPSGSSQVADRKLIIPGLWNPQENVLRTVRSQGGLNQKTQGNVRGQDSRGRRTRPQTPEDLGRSRHRKVTPSKRKWNAKVKLIRPRHRKIKRARASQIQNRKL